MVTGLPEKGGRREGGREDVLLIAHAEGNFGVFFDAAVGEDLVPGGLGIVVDGLGDFGDAEPV
jgi:hypothetical protein